MSSSRLSNGFRPEKAQEVQPNLYIGPLTAAMDYNWQKNEGITHVLTITDTKPWTRKPSHIKHHLDITIDDYGPIRLYINEIVDFIDEGRKEGKVLVHCFAGINRSVSSVIAYLIWKYNMTLEGALQRVKDVRPCANPTKVLLQQVNDYFTSNNILYYRNSDFRFNNK